VNLTIHNIRNSIDCPYSLATLVRHEYQSLTESATHFRITFLLLSLKFVGDTSKNKKRSTSKSVINYNFKQLHRFVTIVSIDVKVYKVTKIYQQSRDEFWLIQVFLHKQPLHQQKVLEIWKGIYLCTFFEKIIQKNLKNSIPPGKKFSTDRNYYTYCY